MRILSIGAFPFPYPQGSQVFATQQARALAAAGAEVTLLTYASGEGPAAPGRLGAGVDHVGSSRALAPRRLRSGPSLGKPAADLALAASAVRLQRARGFDVALAHNVEAAFVAALTRRITGLRFVYVAHTLLERELPSYVGGRRRRPARLRNQFGDQLGDRLGSRFGNRLGRNLDGRAARSADAVLALGEHAGRALSPRARGPLEVIPPGLSCAPPPSAADQQRACERHGLVPHGFFLYAGNLDRYQGLDRLWQAARSLPPGAPPLVVATHDARKADPTTHAPAGATRLIEMASFEALRPLLFSALALVAPRRIAGGFAIKLLNYMEAGRPIVAFESAAEGLDASCAVLLPDETAGEALADELVALVDEPTRADQLGRAARRRCLTAHDWPLLAKRTLALAGLARGPL